MTMYCDNQATLYNNKMFTKKKKMLHEITKHNEVDRLH